ncbi:YcaO-like family protein [Lysobacter sp. ESA13C]|uniref:YcaO-like family protein n=1 Tax=Lysobacter sp. ESA13C TaxID=2862676 RepID=UPI001CBE337D|nr:YcaO-like family protein [Lysobacter sp. ESA13C]
MIPYERERSLDDADRIIRDCIARRGWTVETEDFGGQLMTVKCSLRDAGGELISRGFGKGDAATSMAGALHEAVEHYYCKASRVSTPVEYVAAEHFIDDPRYAALPFLSAFADNRGRYLACRRYRSFFAGRQDIQVPLFLSFPDYPVGAQLDAQSGRRDDFDYRSVIRYSSNSGTAIGASLEEAALHGIGEIVERDAWSLFLLAHYLGGPGRYGALIDPASLPDEVEKVLRLTERRIGRGVLLIDVTSDLGYPTFIATVAERRPDEIVYPHGCGASSYGQYAAMRALTELVQCVDIKQRSDHLAELDRLALEMLAAYPRLQACAYFEVDRDRLERVDWPHPDRPRLAPDLLLPEVVADLEARGIELYYAVNHSEGEDFCVASCVSFELERFFLATSGILMAPGRRGREFLSRLSPANASRAVEAEEQAG